MKLDGALLLLLGIVAVGCFAVLIRIPQVAYSLRGVLTLMVLGGIGGVVFLLGRAHARHRRERRKAPPPPPVNRDS